MSQKEAKKSKRGMWADKEMIQEIQLLENLESELIIENIPEGDIFFALQKLYEVLGFESVGDIKKATFLAPYVLRYYEWHTEAPKSKTLLTKKQKQPKISQVKAPKVAFTLSVKLLKSGVKVSGKTQSGALVKISFASGEFEVLSGSDGKYTFLLDEDFTPGEQKVTVSIFDRYGNMLKSKERNIMLTPQYIREVALKKYKKTLAA